MCDNTTLPHVCVCVCLVTSSSDTHLLVSYNNTLPHTVRLLRACPAILMRTEVFYSSIGRRMYVLRNNPSIRTLGVSTFSSATVATPLIT